MHLFSIIANFHVATRSHRDTIALNNISLHPNVRTSGTRKRSRKIRKKTERLLHPGIVAIVMEEMRSHRESISLIKGETGTGTPVAKADTSVRIQRQRKFMPVPCRRRQAYDVPSTVSRGAYPPISLSLSVSLSAALPSSLRSPARAPIIPPRLCLRMESRFLRVTQPSIGRPRARARARWLFFQEQRFQNF